MKTVTVHVAKTTLSQLITQAEAGEEIVIARDKQPVAKLVPIRRTKPKRRFGARRGLTLHSLSSCPRTS
jgi:antitoxin (DNA-binding transcriptional repressor) of toxin-antitoxin stability system